MNEVCPKDSINWMKYYNFITTNNTHIYEERTILRKWMEIKIDLLLIKIFYYFNNLKLIHCNDNKKKCGIEMNDEVIKQSKILLSMLRINSENFYKLLKKEEKEEKEWI